MSAWFSAKEHEAELDKQYNPGKQAEETLEYVLAEEEEEEDQQAIEEALVGPSVLEHSGGDRTSSRLLYVTSRDDVLDTDSPFYRLWGQLGQLFEEVHILHVSISKGEFESRRVLPNMWLYKEHLQDSVFVAKKAKRFAKEQMVFGEMFRPDMIIATDVQLAGRVGAAIATRYARPLQLHLYEDEFVSSGGLLEGMRTSHVFKVATSVRTDTVALETKILEEHNTITDVKTWPQFYHISDFLNVQPTTNIHTQYPMYSFIVVARGELTADSLLHDVIGSLLPLFKNPRFGLLLIASGPAKALFQEKIRLLNIQKNVVLVDTVPDWLSVVATADVYIELNPHNQHDMELVQAAAAGTPVVTVVNAFRKDLFVHGESAYVCEVHDLECVLTSMRHLLNDNATRVQLAHNAKGIVVDRVHESEAGYLHAYRDSIEAAMVQQDK